MQPGVSACCADAKLRDLLTFIVILYTCNNFFFVMTMTDPNQSDAIFCTLYGNVRWDYAQLHSNDSHVHALAQARPTMSCIPLVYFMI